MKSVLHRFSLSVAYSMLYVMTTSCGVNHNDKIVGRWHLHAYADLCSSSLTLTRITQDEKYILHMHDTGFFSFTTDCNTISGEYTAKDSELKFLNPSATEIACEHETVERSVKMDISMVCSYKQPSDTSLCLLDERGNVLMELGKVRDWKR